MRANILCVAGIWLTLFSGVLWAGEAAAQETESGAIETMNEPPIATELAKLREGLPPLDYENPRTISPRAVAYFDFYGLHTPQHKHYFGTFNSGHHVLATHIFIPESARGTVLLMHGFLDHVGTVSSTAQHLLKQGFAVAAYDQPGHGLSNGPRASINDFADYASIFDDFLQLVRTHMPPPYHVVAHSTGASIVVDHLLTHKEDDFGRVVLVAPLVRSAFWGLSTTFTPVADAFVDYVPRVFQDNSSDEQFLEFVRQDPLQPRETSLAWFNALMDWNERIQNYPPNPRPIVIIQGNADTIVDWEYNLEFLLTKFPNARVEMIDEGRHQLLNEGPELKTKVRQILDDVLAVQANPQ